MGADVLDPARGDLSDEDEAGFAFVPLEVEVGPVLLDAPDRADQQFAFFRPFVGTYLERPLYSRTSTIVLPDKSALPPAGRASVAPQMEQAIEVDALSKMMAS